MNHLVGAKGQVVIPKEIRDALDIRPGQEVVFEQRGDEVILRAARMRPLRGRFPDAALTAELLRSRREDTSFEHNIQR